MTTTVPEGILEMIKAYLHITWEDANTELNLIDAIESSVAYLQGIAGVSAIDFEVNRLARDLLKDRCRYINSQALEVFEKNFASELMSLHIQSLVDSQPDVVEV
ncbi:hypothetical protein [Clostridium estertheticum]|uniref:Phage gp6-like head-tail connector protein n=1 Tax=Clostridium estertheticum subsp. estertheticum TaxID=1552 RepID=A0A1J0GJL5_9CLOT|nr:hypothetical protein [Clostridium estertheticum]APC41529.1 hypothetical protein A7L45_16315 [Clostridium estertheticum subsp. estertheticum]